MPTADRYQQYELLRRDDGSFWELGRGSMGITYKAYDTNLRFPVALKVINSAYLENDTARQRFLREARAAAALRHPNVASVFNLGEVQEKYFYVMEFIDGETLEARVKREGPLRPVEALNIALQVTRALAAAARQQLVHRDLKPTNLMLVEEEGELTVKVIDFGLAKITKETGEESAALTVGGFVGTPHFASPEQVEDGDIDIRSDIYSLGATLYFVLTGQSPFSGSIGQVMSQHLYKPLPLEPLKDQPGCVASLVQRMMAKDPNARPQTPQELQKEILACLTEIRGMATQDVPRIAEPMPSETIDMSVASGQPLAPGATIAQVYYLIEEIGDSPLGRRFLADDLLHRLRVSLLVLSPDLLADNSALTSLRETVNLVRKAPHPMLQEIYALETFTDCTLLTEEYISGTSLRDVLRVRGALTAPEIVRLLSLLAPLADHATTHGLQHIDFSLSGIRFINREGNREGLQSTTLRRPLTAWESAHPKVNAIDLSFLPASKGTWSGMATQMQGVGPGASASSCVRLLSLLAYELLGGPRSRLEATGRYTPVASLTQEGNAVLRSGLVDEYKSAAELVRQLDATARVPPSHAQPSDTAGPSISESSAQRSSTQIPSEPPPQPPTDDIPAGAPIDRRPKAVVWLFALACLLLILLLGVSVYLLRPPAQGPPVQQIAQIPALTVQTEPPGAAVLLDGKPPQAPTNTFTHVPFGVHHLSATLDGYEPVRQDLQVRRGMAPEVRLRLKPIVEVPALVVHTEPPGASVRLDSKEPQAPPNTFTHVPFGPHQLSVTLNGYEPLKQELQVRRGMAPEIRLQLKPIVEVPALTVHTEPSGASVLLDGKAPDLPPDTFTHVPFGSHELAAALEGYEPIKRNLAVVEGMNPEIRLQLKASPAPDSFEAYFRDAQRGDSSAMMKLGRLYFKKGTPADDIEGFNWLNRAYNAPNPNLEAGAYIGDCYLSGRGTKQDVQKAEEIIMPLANQNVIPAMTLAGRIFQYKGELKRAEAAQSADTQTRKRLEVEASEMDRLAVSWWERAQKDDWNAAAHLGKSYEQGWGGLEKNLEQAEVLYKGGASHGNPLSMLFYGLMIENRPGRHHEAELLISKAAAAGLPSAVKWCKDNNVDFNQRISNGDQ